MRVFIFLLATVAAQQVLAQFDYDEAREILNYHQAKWNDNGLAQYRITYSLDCYCADVIIEPVNAIYRNGRIESISREVSNPGAIPHAGNMFGIVEDAINSQHDIKKIIYDEEFGYPKYVEFNSQADDIYVEAHTFEVTKLPEDIFPATREEIQSIVDPGQTLPDTGIEAGPGSAVPGRKLFQTSFGGKGFVSGQREIRPGKKSQ